MKLSVKPELLKYMLLSAGVLGLVLRMVLYAVGIDEKGLLISNHWAGVSVWILTVVMAAALMLLTRPIQGPANYRDAYPTSFFGGIGALALAGAIALTTISELKTAPSLITTALGFAAAAALAFISFCRLSRMKPIFLCHAAVCAYFAMRMISQYQHWSSNPQIQDYVFYLGAYVALMLTAYQHAAFDAGMGNHRSLWTLSLAAVYLCCLSLQGGMDTWLLLACSVWAFTNLTNLKVRPRRQRPALILEDKPQEEV